MTIIEPRLEAGHPDRGINCQAAAEADFQELAERIEAVGWTGDEAAAALLGLALAHIQGRVAAAELERAIRWARESVRES